MIASVNSPNEFPRRAIVATIFLFIFCLNAYAFQIPYQFNTHSKIRRPSNQDVINFSAGKSLCSSNVCCNGFERRRINRSITVMSANWIAVRRTLAFTLFSRAAFATVGGGVLSGGLHAISGPDHLAALLPRIMGKAWPVSMRIGAVWGLGHGLSATIIGTVAFFLKDKIGGRFLSNLGLYTEALVGISLITIGLLGLRESLGETTAEQENTFKESSSKRKGQTAIFLNGLLHGFSWDGAPSLAPALACTTWQGVLCFLLAYCAGTMATMSMATSAIGEGSVRVGQALEQPDVPKRLSIISSGVAIAIGFIWLLKAFLFSG